MRKTANLLRYDDFSASSEVLWLTWSFHQPGAECVKLPCHRETFSEVSKGLDPTDENKVPETPALLFIKCH